ncbi:MAG: hypothetical protein LUH18_08270 [Oscillospiraceae bacterium]|nr:hypothetical protein [Oscillospiraceae bacterium]
MKKRKLFPAIAIMLAVITLFSGCEMPLLGNKTYKLYSEAVSTLEKAGGYDVDCTVDVYLYDDSGNIESATLEMNIKANGDNAQVSADYGELGFDYVTTVIDDRAYFEIGDYCVYFTIPDSYYDTYDYDSLVSEFNLPELAEKVFSDVEVEENTRGMKRFTVTLSDDDDYGDMIDELIMSFFVEDDIDIDLSDVTYVMTFDSNGYLSTMEMSCGMVLSAYDESMYGNITAEYTFTDFGFAPKIKLSHDISEYTYGGELET